MAQPNESYLILGFEPEGFLHVERTENGGLYLETHDGDEQEIRFELTPEQVAQLQEFLA